MYMNKNTKGDSESEVSEAEAIATSAAKSSPGGSMKLASQMVSPDDNDLAISISDDDLSLDDDAHSLVCRKYTIQY